MIVDNLHRLYPGMEVDAASTFRVTRSAELLLDARAAWRTCWQAVEEEVRRRRSRPVVRVEVEDSMMPRLRALLLRELRHDTPEQAWPLGDEDVYDVEGLIDLRGLRELASLEIERGHWPPEAPRAPLDPRRCRSWTCCAARGAGGVPARLVRGHRRALRAGGGGGPRRGGGEAGALPHQQRARASWRRCGAPARGGKQVVALVELTARFDEERNIEWARYLRYRRRSTWCTGCRG